MQTNNDYMELNLYDLYTKYIQCLEYVASCHFQANDNQNIHNVDRREQNNSSELTGTCIFWNKPFVHRYILSSRDGSDHLNIAKYDQCFKGVCLKMDQTSLAESNKKTLGCWMWSQTQLFKIQMGFTSRYVLQQAISN